MLIWRFYQQNYYYYYYEKWSDHKKKSENQRKKQFKGLANFCYKLQYQNIAVLKDAALVEGHAHRLSKQNFDIANLLEESLARNNHYERLLHKHKIPFGDMEVTHEEHQIEVRDKALYKYVD